MNQSPTQTPENQECQQGSDCRNGRLLNTEGPKCEKPAQKNVHRWGNCVLPADHAGFCYYRDSDGEARQANYGTAENPARCSDAMDRAGRLNELRNMAYLALRLHWDDADASRMVKEAGDDPELLHKLQGKIPNHPRSIEDTRKLYEQPLMTNGQPGSFQAIPIADRERTSVQASMSQLEAAVKLLAKQRDEALERCSQLELANAALRKAAGL